MIVKRQILVVLAVFLMAVSALAQVNARMFRFPDVSATHITFVYAGDIWIVPKAGGEAHRLSSPPGEESFPRFSPDGSMIAFSGNYDGNEDVYIIPAMGGIPKRLTYHPMRDRLLDWRPSGRGLLFSSTRECGRTRFSQIYSLAKEGGFPEKLPLAYGEFGVLSPDEKRLAFTPLTRAFRPWKRYRGGFAPDIWIFDLETKEARNISQSEANDDYPMWHGQTLYFLSDRGTNQRQNIWKYELASGKLQQVTNFEDVDITFPAIGPSDIVFEAGGRLCLLDLQSDKYKEVKINVVTDLATLKPYLENVEERIESADISPSGKRALFSARGELFSVPAEHGIIQNFTQSSGSAERYPAWSPDGKSVAYWSDESGEYELYIRPADGSGRAEKMTDLGKGFRYHLFWSPDCKKLAFIDHSQTIQVFDIESRSLKIVDQCSWMLNPILEAFEVGWSGDSNWIAYTKLLTNKHGAVFLYDLRENKRHQVTSGFYSDSGPVFDPDGKYLYYLSDRSLSPVYSDLDETWVYPNTTKIAAVSLRWDVPSPLAPRNDVEAAAKNEESQPEKDRKQEKSEKAASVEKKPEKEKKPEPVQIDLEGFEKRSVILPPEAGNYTDLRALPGQILYRRLPRTGSNDRNRSIVTYQLENRKEETILEDSEGFAIAADGKKMLVYSRNSFYIVDIKPGQKLGDRLRTSELETVINPKAEWKQMFNDIWRKYRDLFYDPGMHGVDWEAVRSQYGALLNDAVTRWDANFIYSEVIAELNASHTYVGGGDLERSRSVDVGLLGVDWALENGAYRIARIIEGAPWDSEVRSPLRQPGVGVKEGEYILAVNGVPLDPAKEPYAAFQGLAEKTVILMVSNKPTMEGAREVLVETLKDEAPLRQAAWVEKNRKQVEKATSGRVGYIYMPDTALNGQRELVRMFYGQIDKDGFVIDERFNNGGQLADRFVELLSRPVVHHLAWRYGEEIQQPAMANPGPKVMLINGWSGSGGDALPYTFRQQKVGPIIGMRTWGGLIGPAIGHETVDGGRYTVPEGRIYGNDGKWFAEGHGVEPDILVINDPGALAKGFDPQLERAIEEVKRLIEANPPEKIGRPDYEDRTPRSQKER